MSQITTTPDTRSNRKHQDATYISANKIENHTRKNKQKDQVLYQRIRERQKETNTTSQERQEEARIQHHQTL